MARYVELRRHTDADGDVLTQEGVRAATEIGARLDGGYDLLVSTGAQRATQTLACFLAALGERVPGGVVVEAGLRSEREERWREAYEKAGSGALEAMRAADPEFVEADSAALGAALGRVLDALPDGGRAGRDNQQLGRISKCSAVAVCWKYDSDANDAVFSVWVRRVGGRPSAKKGRSHMAAILAATRRRESGDSPTRPSPDVTLVPGA